jgi:hypothetical protein
MTELLHAIYVLIGIVITGMGTVAAAYLYQVKVSLPRRFKQQTEERQIQLDAMRKDFENQAAEKSVEIERDKMFPSLLENMMQSNRSTVQMAESFHTTMMQSVVQTANWSAQLKAHDGMLTANTDRLEELAQTVETAITNIQLLKTAVEVNTDHSKSAAAFGNQAATAATETLELVKREINKLVVTSKGDTGEIKPHVEKVSDAAVDGEAAA